MSYPDNFEHSFMQHTLKVLQAYEGEFGATILVNCLLGLLVVPKASQVADWVQAGKAVPKVAASSFTEYKG